MPVPDAAAKGSLNRALAAFLTGQHVFWAGAMRQGWGNSVVRWDPFVDNGRLTERFGGRFRGGWPEEPDSDTAGVHQPRADQYEGPESVTIEIELPGVSARDIAVQISGDFVVVEAERRFVRNSRQVRQLESNYGKMRREFALPVRARPEQVVAELRQGFLRITVPRQPGGVFHDRTITPTETDGPHRIEVT